MAHPWSHADLREAIWCHWSGWDAEAFALIDDIIKREYPDETQPKSVAAPASTAQSFKAYKKDRRERRRQRRSKIYA